MPRTKKSVKQRQNLPTPPSLWQTLGPSFILLGLALGSGELLLWPYLGATYGLGLLWGALLGITFQYVLNTEVMRYSLAWGESLFLGFRRWSRFFPLWFILSTFIPWSLPGFSSASSQILVHFFPWMNQTLVAVLLLLLTGVALTAGKTLYKTMETLQKTVILIGIPFLIFLTFWLSNPTDWQEAVMGLVGYGQNWWLFPPNIGLFAFLGAFAYSGAGGNLNLAQTYYVKEKGFGMGRGTQKISSLLSKEGEQKVQLEGKLFKQTPANFRKWEKWWSLVATEHFLVFWLLGFVTIVVLTVMAKTLVFGQAHGEGLAFLYQQAEVMSSLQANWVGSAFLAIAAVMLFSTQLGVLESSSRIISENILLLFYQKGNRYNVSQSFYYALWGQIILGIIVLLVGFEEPRFLLTLAAVLNAAAMMVAFPLVWLLNRQRLPAKIQAGWLRQLITWIAFIFFVVFVFLTVRENFL